MAGNVNHEYHILEPDIWPFVGSFSALTFTSGMVLYMHEMASAHLVLGLGIANLARTDENQPSRSNKLMRLRIFIQAIAIALLVGIGFMAGAIHF